MPEKGHVTPGALIVGADSHTCTYGAFGAFATGIGSTEAAAVFATGKIWLKVPEAIKINVNGQFQKYVTPKDLILAIIGKLGVDGAIYKSVEFTGATIRGMGMAGRMTLCNMAVEMGAKNGIIAPDAITRKFLENRVTQPLPVFDTLQSDADAAYARTVEFDVSELEPQVACPSSVDNVKPAAELNAPIDQAFIGSCTNSRLSDLRLAAGLFKGRKVAPGVRVLVVPGSQEVKKQAEAEGLDRVFREAGADWRYAGCSMCIAMNGDQLQPGQYAVSTSNRNFEGRQGKGGRTFLASPLTAAAAAITGCITDVRTML